LKGGGTSCWAQKGKKGNVISRCGEGRKPAYLTTDMPTGEKKGRNYYRSDFSSPERTIKSNRRGKKKSLFLLRELALSTVERKKPKKRGVLSRNEERKKTPHLWERKDLLSRRSVSKRGNGLHLRK